MLGQLRLYKLEVMYYNPSIIEKEKLKGEKKMCNSDIILFFDPDTGVLIVRFLEPFSEYRRVRETWYGSGKMGRQGEVTEVTYLTGAERTVVPRLNGWLKRPSTRHEVETFPDLGERITRTIINGVDI